MSSSSSLSASASANATTTITTNAPTSANTKTKKKQRWSRSEKRAAALQEEKRRPTSNRFLQCAQQCPLGATILQSPEEEHSAVRVVTSTASSSLDSKDCHIHIKPLLILDLNGILCHRIRKSKESKDDESPIVYRPFDAHVARTPVIARPHLHAFLQHLLASNVCLALWTSAKRKTVHDLLEQLQIPSASFLFVWGQDQCLTTIDGDAIANDDDKSPLFQKDLQKVWNRYPLWNHNNTLLMDDSMEKIIPSQEQIAMHPVPLNGRQFVELPSTSLLLHDNEVCREQNLFIQMYVQHWHEHALWQEHANITDAEKLSATTAKNTTTTRWQWDCLREYSRPTMRWGGDGLACHSTRNPESLESSAEDSLNE